MKYCKKCKIAGKECDTVCPKCGTQLSSFGSAAAAKPAMRQPVVPPVSVAAGQKLGASLKTFQPPLVTSESTPRVAAPLRYSQPPPTGAAARGSVKGPTFTLAGQIAELEQIKEQNLKRGRNLGILSLVAALAILILIYAVYSRTVLSYAILENIEIEQDPVAESQITVSFDVKTPGKVAFDRQSGTGHTEKVDFVTAAGHRSTEWAWPSDPKTGIDFSVVSRSGWFCTRTDKHFKVTRANVGVEIVFLLDITSSMQPYIDGLKDKCIAFADHIRSEGIDCQLGLIAFGDVNYNESMVVFEPNADIKKFQEAIAGLELTDGHDIDESSVEAIEKALELEFRPHTRICFVHITDAGCHNRQRIPDLVDALKENKVVTYVISDPDLKRLYGELCVNGGSYYPIRNAPFESILKEVAKSITNQIKSN